MIEHSLHGSFRLISVSKKEAAIYLLAAFAGAWLYVYTCGLLGVDGAYAGNEALKTSPLRYFLASLPGLLLMSWFAAGLTGRVTMQAVKGEAEGLARYANGWYLRKAGFDFVFVCISWVPMWLMSFNFSVSTFAAVVWLIAIIWLSLRLTFWLNISIMEDLGLLEAAKRSYGLTRGRVWAIIMISAAPVVLAKGLELLINKLFSFPAAPAYYVRSLFDAAAVVFLMGAFAAAYVEISTKTPAAEPPDPL